MNRKIALTLIVAAAAAGSAFAESPVDSGAGTFHSSASRSEVQAQLRQHRQGGVDTFADGYDALRGFRSERTRAQARAEYIADRDQVAAMSAEDSGSRYIARRESPRMVGPQLAALPVQPE